MAHVFKSNDSCHFLQIAKATTTTTTTSARNREPVSVVREPVSVGQRRAWKARGRWKGGGTEGRVGGCSGFGEVSKCPDLG